MKLQFTLVGGPTWVLDIDNTLKIGCDPGLAPKGTAYSYKGLKTSRVVAPVYTNATFDNASLWLLSHGHFDHIDEPGLAVIPEKATVISHKNCAKFLKTRKDLNVHYLTWHETRNINTDGYSIEVEAIPAIHGMNFIAKILMGGVNGYLLTIRHGKEEKRVYISSDTVFLNEIPAALKNRNIDLFIANMGQAKSKMIGGPFTMNTEMLNRFIREIKPGFTVPIHTDDYAHFETSRSELKLIEKNNLKVLDNGDSIKVP